MPVTPTARLGINTWTAGTDPFTRAQRNADAAVLDALVAIYGQGTFAERPVGHIEGRFYLVRDAADVDHDGELYYDDGATWELINATEDLSAYETSAHAAATYATIAALAAHAAAGDPHPGYATDADLAAHAAAGDPHPTYLTQPEGDARYLGIAAKAADSDLLDGIDSTGFARNTVDVNSPRRYTRDFLLMGG